MVASGTTGAQAEEEPTEQDNKTHSEQTLRARGNLKKQENGKDRSKVKEENESKKEEKEKECKKDEKEKEKKIDEKEREAKKEQKEKEKVKDKELNGCEKSKDDEKEKDETEEDKKPTMFEKICYSMNINPNLVMLKITLFMMYGGR